MTGYRRKHKRFRTFSLIEVSHSREVEVKKKEKVIDISMGGLGFMSSNKYSMGETVIFNFAGETYSLFGVIRRIQTEDSCNYYGVEFEDIHCNYKINLSGLISTMCTHMVA